jgi:membrane-bound lytic murein transglycosylase
VTKLIEELMMKALLPLICLIALTACSDKPPEPQATPKSDTATTTTPWDGMKQDEQRAKDVQKVVDKQAEQQDKQVESQTQ